MASLLMGKRETEQQAIISAVAAKTASFSTPRLEDGKDLV
jgi:hypothetical protein